MKLPFSRPQLPDFKCWLWLIPVVVGAVGVGVELIRRQHNRVLAKRRREARAQKRDAESRLKPEEEEKRVVNREGAFDAISNALLLDGATANNESLSSQRIVFGETITNGAQILYQTDDTNTFLYHLYILAGHKCEGIYEIHINNINVRTDHEGYVVSPPYFIGRPYITTPE